MSKVSSRSYRPVVTFRPVFNMIKALLFSLSIATLCCSSGCLFSKKSGRPKESSTISADVEENFRRRWVEKRASELAAQGVAADAAQVRAESEFRERYSFTREARK